MVKDKMVKAPWIKDIMEKATGQEKGSKLKVRDKKVWVTDLKVMGTDNNMYILWVEFNDDLP